MIDEKRLLLEQIVARGPWRGWVRGREWDLSGDELRAYYEAISSGAVFPNEVLGCTAGSRKADRANALLRRAGLIYYDRDTIRWKAAVRIPG